MQVKEYKLLLAEKLEVQAASKPRLLTLQDARTPQERVEEIWSRIAQRLKIHTHTIRPHPTKGQSWIIAVPLHWSEPKS